MQLLVDTYERIGTTIVLVTHEEDYAKLAKSRIYLKDGQIVSSDESMS
jgi:ABC-type lipoprotein export system ATPase subunit